MKVFKCPKCGSVDVFIENSGNQKGLYCGDCGKWIKWVSKDEEKLVVRQENLMKDKRVTQIIDSMKKGKECL